MSHSHSKRRDTDVMKLMMAKYRVTLADGGTNPHDFYVKFHGPNDSNYSGGIWKIHVILPTEYPYKSPSIGFCNKIFHPNIDEPSGSVCLDVINQTWSPMYDLVNVFSVFLPQLLLYPNPSDPLNPHAAMMMLKDNTNYERTIKEYVKKYASVDFVMEDDEDEDEDEEEQKKEKIKEDNNNNNKMKTEIINPTSSSNNNTTTTNNNTIHSNSPSMDSSSLSPTVTTHPSLSMSDVDDDMDDFDEFQLMEIEDEVFSDIDDMPLETETITV